MDGGDANELRPVATAGEAAAILRPAFVLWLVVLALFGAAELATAVLGAREPEGGDGAAVLTGGLVLTELVLVAVFALRDRHRWRALGARSSLVVVLCVLAGLAGALALGWLQRLAWGRTMPAESLASDPRVLGALFAGAVLPAVFEELLYRGVILGRLREVLPAPLAVATQAGLAAVTHGAPELLLPQLAFGCMAGAVRLDSGALWPCMLMHLAWNGWLVLEHHGRL